MGHLPQTLQTTSDKLLSLCILSGSVWNLAFSLNVDKRLLLFCHIYQTLKNLIKSQVSFRNLTAIHVVSC